MGRSNQSKIILNVDIPPLMFTFMFFMTSEVMTSETPGISVFIFIKMFNETVDYTICSFDPEHYNRIDVRLPSPQTRNAKMVITSLTTKCSIVVLNNDDFIQITIIRKEDKEFKYYNYTLNFESSYTNLNAESFVDLLKEQTNSIGIVPEIDYTGRITLTSKLYNFMITNASYNVIQLLGIYNQTLPITGEHKNSQYELLCSSVGNYLSTPILYLVSNVGKSSFRNLNDTMNVSKIMLRINNAFSADYPIVVSNADFEVDINSNDLSCAQFTLVDANMHEIKLLSPMYITIAVHGVLDEVFSDPINDTFERMSEPERAKVLSPSGQTVFQT